MDNKNMKNLFEALTPRTEQKERMFREILTHGKTEHTEQSNRAQRTPGLLHNRRLLRPVIACALCLILGLGVIPFMGGPAALTAYAYGTNTEITDTGVELSTGTISDDGEMRGQLFQMYIKGKNIDTIRYSCKNQYIDFTDWTQKRENHSRAKSFTVHYGDNASDYYYLVVNWNPDKTIRALTDNTDIGIADLGDELRNDVIVMQVTFMNGSTATKAVNIRLQDNGKITASFADYVITSQDSFVLEPKEEPQAVPAPPDEEASGNEAYSDADIAAAKLIAERYYEGFKGGHKITAIEYTEDSPLLSHGVPDKYRGWQVIAFKAYEKSNSPNISRTILLARQNSGQKWTVINEGY